MMEEFGLDSPRSG